MSSDKTRASIGLPVYNGENFLEAALCSLLAQTHSDFELIISDNASADRTEEICRAFAARDRRIRYYRNNTNIGSARNFYRAFELSSGEYFKWAAHDDLNAPEFLERCINVLDQESSIVLCYPKTKIIDERGRFLRDYDFAVDTTSPKPHVRLYNILRTDHWCFQIFGVMRADIFRKMLIYEGFRGYDRNMLAEFCLFGRVYEWPEFLFFRRDHSGTSANLYAGSSQQFATYDPPSSQLRYLAWRRFRGYFAAVAHAPLNVSERLLCYMQLMRLIAEKSVDRVSQRMWRRQG